MAIIDNYPGARVPVTICGRCCNCLQPLYRELDGQMIHIGTDESRCQLYATLKNEENQ